MYINYTTHELVIVCEDKGKSWQEIIKLPPVKGATIPRVEYDAGQTTTSGYDGLKVVRTNYNALGRVVDHEEMMAELGDGGVAIVSALVAQTLCLPNVVSPGDPLRDEDGRPVACDGLKGWFKA